MNFIQEFLQGVRIEGFSPPQPFYPFSRESIKLILDRETDLVPRKIIMGMRRVFERSIRQSETIEEISPKTAEEILNKMNLVND